MKNFVTGTCDGMFGIVTTADITLKIGCLTIASEKDVRVRLRTGSARTEIPLQLLGMSESDAMKFKNQEITHQMEAVIKINDLEIINTYPIIQTGECPIATIGMDIMKNWNMSMFTDKNGVFIFLGCPHEHLKDPEYLAEIDRIYGKE